MAKMIDDLEILKVAEEIGDLVWAEVMHWKNFEKETVGKQLTRSSDSIGANLAEAFGRFHYGEKLKHIYYSRGSLFETKYWINRAVARKLMRRETGSRIVEKLSNLALRINSFARFLKSQKAQTELKEVQSPYLVDNVTTDQQNASVYSDEEIAILSSLSITNNE